MVGVDHSSKLLAVARREEARQPQGVRFHKADLARLAPLADSSFNMIVSNVVM